MLVYDGSLTSCGKWGTEGEIKKKVKNEREGKKDGSNKKRIRGEMKPYEKHVM